MVTLTGSIEFLQVDRLIDNLKIWFILVYIDADWVKWRNTSV